MAQMYEESMPITTLLPIEDCILVAGGGGNVLFGFPNRLFLLSPEKEVLDEKDACALVITAKAYANLVILQHEESFELVHIEDKKIKGPFKLPEGCESPVVVDGSVVFLAEGKVMECPVEDLLSDSPEPSTVPYAFRDGGEPQGKILRLTTSQNSLACITEGAFGTFIVHSLLSGEHKPSPYPDGMGQTGAQKKHVRKTYDVFNRMPSAYTAAPESAYVTQLADKKGVVTMVGSRKYMVIEKKCIVVASLGNDEYILGTGEGCIIKYCKGAEVWRRKISSNPISSIVRQGPFLYCSTIHGQIFTVREKYTPLIYSKKFGALMFAAGAVAVNYMAPNLFRKCLGWIWG